MPRRRCSIAAAKQRAQAHHEMSRCIGWVNDARTTTLLPDDATFELRYKGNCISEDSTPAGHELMRRGGRSSAWLAGNVLLEATAKPPVVLEKHCVISEISQDNLFDSGNGTSDSRRDEWIEASDVHPECPM